jgi:hypothetical protein
MGLENRLASSHMGSNPILSVRYGAEINGFSSDFSLKALFNVV